MAWTPWRRAPALPDLDERRLRDIGLMRIETGRPGDPARVGPLAGLAGAGTTGKPTPATEARGDGPAMAGAVLVAIDMQQAFDTPPWPRRWNEAVDRNGLALLAAWRRRGMGLIHVRHDSVEPGSTLRAGLPGHAFRPGFEPLPGEPVVAKSVNAAFIGTDLDLRLRRMRARRVVVFGISTDMCVSTTVRVGANLGWPMHLVENACDCFDLPDGRGGTVPAEAVHRAHVATLGFEFARVTTSAELIAALERAA